ncbi:MarR family winged helix-turn-helix transcriptional regulator [Lacisediminihabitans sp. FW035]
MESVESDTREASLVSDDVRLLGEPTSNTRLLARALHHLDIEHRRIRAIFAGSLHVSGSEFNALMHLGEMGEVTPKALAKELALTTGAMTSMVDRLEAAGLVLRRPNPVDRRSLFVRLSPRGEEAREEVYRRYFEAVTEAVDTWHPQNGPRAIDVLEHVATAIRSTISPAG